jgi:alkylhydroperoxidase family enzyme
MSSADSGVALRIPCLGATNGRGAVSALEHGKIELPQARRIAEAVTRLSDRPDPVPDEIWNEATRHFDERALAALILWIAVTNVWNRLNVSTRQIAGEWTKSAAAQKWTEKAASSP